MKFSSKIQRCELSPMRKFLPYELAAEAKGRKIYHLNIGQPDIETPKAFFDAVKNFQDPVLAYAAAPGVSEFLTAVQGYYANLGIHLEQSDIYATAGGSVIEGFVEGETVKESDLPEKVAQAIRDAYEQVKIKTITFATYMNDQVYHVILSEPAGEDKVEQFYIKADGTIVPYTAEGTASPAA
mgnify:CR=1 FL=1